MLFSVGFNINKIIAYIQEISDEKILFEEANKNLALRFPHTFRIQFGH